MSVLLPMPIFAANQKASTELDISGYGFLGNLGLKRSLKLMEGNQKSRPFYDANYIEDAALILISTLKREGYLKPRIKAVLSLENGEQKSVRWDEITEEPLPHPLRATRVEFKIEKGVLYHFQEIEFQGLQSLPEKRARSFFVESATLLLINKTRVYTPGRLDGGLTDLVAALERQGYASAEASVAELKQDDQTGDVRVTIKVREGPKSIVRSVRKEVFVEKSQEPEEVSVVHPGVPYSNGWLQDFSQALKATNYARGYPDTIVNVTTIRRESTSADVIQIDLLASVKTGPRVTVGEVKFIGGEKTKESVLRRRVPLDEGKFLDRINAERGRYRLARLGIFDTVELNYEPVDDASRDVLYRLKARKRIELSLLFGYGSYELLRGGLELEQFNIFGLAHHSRLRLVQSFKSSSADYIYTMPELFRESMDVFLNASALRREEISFTREEYGGGAGVKRYLSSIATEVSVRYNYQILNTADAEVDPTEGVPNAGVGAIITDVRHDRRDNPLYPRSGYKLFANLELASPYLASEVAYQRFELAASYHLPLDPGRWLHFGLSHGVVFAAGGPQKDLPFNKRFFPGGENSIRGYQDGEAAPRDAAGKIVGAETYLSTSLEFEQALTPAWALVTFFDAVGFANQIKDYPFNETLYSVGGGIRWRTIIGPARLEYGYNLNPREHDPVGTLHFALGFPF
jgi:outer membrane protein assembly complex protein YaeT